MEEHNQPQQVVIVDNKSGLGTASLIIGIISLVTCGSTIILPILGMLLGIMARNPVTKKMDGNGKAGFICSAISAVPVVLSLLVGLVWVLVVVVFGAAACNAAGSMCLML